MRVTKMQMRQKPRLLLGAQGGLDAGDVQINSMQIDGASPETKKSINDDA